MHQYDSDFEGVVHLRMRIIWPQANVVKRNQTVLLKRFKAIFYLRVGLVLI